jgi:hypothetical protein
MTEAVPPEPIYENGSYFLASLRAFLLVLRPQFATILSQ